MTTTNMYNCCNALTDFRALPIPERVDISFC